MPRLTPLALLVTALAAPAFGSDGAAVPKDGFCITNASTVPHIFTTETREGHRQVVELAPKGRLCATNTAAKDGIVGVFESLDAIEGCARIVARGEAEELIEYAEFDRCRWGSHGP